MNMAMDLESGSVGRLLSVAANRFSLAIQQDKIGDFDQTKVPTNAKITVRQVSFLERKKKKKKKRA